jgi:hypothetical protein
VRFKSGEGIAVENNVHAFVSFGELNNITQDRESNISSYRAKATEMKWLFLVRKHNLVHSTYFHIMLKMTGIKYLVWVG